MRRAALVFLLTLNLVGGLVRYSNLDPFGSGRLWDLTGVVHVVAACNPESFLSDTPSPACRSLPPYLPLAFPLFLGIAALAPSSVEVAWLLLMGGALLAVFAREAMAWAGSVPRDSRGCGLASQRASFTVFALVVVSLVAFKGTSLGMLAGQPSLPVTMLLYAFASLESRAGSAAAGLTTKHLAAATCLALAATKPNIALPFFVYLLLRRDLTLLGLAAAATIVVQFAASFAWLGPVGSLHLLVQGAEAVGNHPRNVAEIMGASGRVDLEPLLAVFGLGDGSRRAVLAALGLGAAAGLARFAARLDPRVLLFEINVVFVALLYHRDYDLLLLVLLAQPLLREHHAKFGLLACLAALPAALPLQWAHTLGMNAFPRLAFAWNFLGCSMVLGVIGVGLWMLAAAGEGRRAGARTDR